MVPIVQKGDPVLRQIAAEVPIEEITSPKIQTVIAHMKKALASQNDGVAIAAPQIGESLRIFVISGNVLTDALRSKDEKIPPLLDMVFINPKILKLSKDKEKMSEGCLSVRWLYGNVDRAKKAKVRAYNEYGNIFEKGGSGLLAQIFQHEIDHLDGVLFVDKAEDVEELPPENH